MSRRGAVPFFGVLAAALALCPGTPAQTSCATLGIDCANVVIEPVHVGNVNPADALNVLFVPDGFSTAGSVSSGSRDGNELAAFQCATRILKDRLLASDPFKNYGCHINFYRLRGVSSYDTICGGESRWPQAIDTETCPEFDSSPGTAPTYDFGTGCSGGSGSPSHLLSLSEYGEHLVECLGTCGPNIDTVVVLADSTANAGAGETNAYAQRKRVISTIYNIGYCAEGGECQAFWTLAHELGHALGLLDEYTKDATSLIQWHEAVTANGGTLPQYQAGRNVWSSCPSNARPPGDVIWADQCLALFSAAGPPLAAGCCATDPPAGFLPCPLRGCAERSQCLPASAPPALRPCDPPSACLAGGGGAFSDSPIGFYEGAFYRYCRYFRSSPGCRMNSPMQDPFCRACNCWVKDYLGNPPASLGFPPLLECQGPSICLKPAPPPNALFPLRIMIKDCAADTGSVPSNCAELADSEAIQLRLDQTPPDIRVCMINASPRSIARDEWVHVWLYVARQTPTMERLAAGQVPPAVGRVSVRVSQMEATGVGWLEGAAVGEPPVDWGQRAERCVNVPIESSSLPDLTDLASLSVYYAYAVVGIEGDLPNGETDVRYDPNKARISVEELYQRAAGD